MEIIMHGKYYKEKNHIATCENCGCQFKWELTDIVNVKRTTDYDAYYGQRKFDYMYTTCPECGLYFVACKKLVENNT